MKRKIIYALITLVAVYTIYNQFDINDFEAEFSKEKVKKIIGIPDYSKKNGYYRLFTLNAASNVDIESDTLYQQYRDLLMSSRSNKDSPRPKFRKSDIPKIIRDFTSRHKGASKWFDQQYSNSLEWCTQLLQDREAIRALQKKMAIYLDRYQRLLDSEIFDDISSFPLLFSQKPGDADYASPNLLAWRKTAQFHIIVHSLTAIEGEWETGFSKLTDHLQFLKGSLKNQRMLINKMIHRSHLYGTLFAINCLMNRKDCPPSVFRKMASLPELVYAEYGNARQILAETILGPMGWYFYEYQVQDDKEVSFLYRLFFQKNRTLKLFETHLKQHLVFDQTPPYQWDKAKDYFLYKRTGLLWWLQNPFGKQHLEIMLKVGNSNYIRLKSLSYEIKAIYDLTRIAAELHLKYDGTRQISSLLKDLKTYQKLIDPFSGNPFKWNAKTNTLYSVGIDKTDNQGKYDINHRFTKNAPSDFGIPAILFVK